MTTIRLALTSALLLLLLVVPATAQAGVAKMTSDALVYNAYAGEVNDVTVTVESKRSLLITDATGQVNVEERCVKLSDHQARCSARPNRELLRFRHSVHLQDGDDKGRGPANIRGGEGNDEIVDETPVELWANTGYGFVGSTGDAGNDTIVGSGHGNEGNDVLRALPGKSAELYGGIGDDRFEGGSADDFFAPGPGSDHVASGGGRDWLSFDDNPFDPVGPQAPVVFSLENGAQGGRAGENDTYEGTFVEVRVGPSPGSVVTGNDLNNRIIGLGTLRGLAGDDELISGGDRLRGNVQSDDRLEGGDGDDRLEGRGSQDVDDFDGGAGDDWIFAVDLGDVDGDSPSRGVEPHADVISCGPGKDRIDVDSADPRPADCEIVALLFDSGATITGTPEGDVLPGYDFGGPDKILGGGGDDQIEAGWGADSLYGQDGNDRLIGERASAERSANVNDGNGDKVSGGAGDDHLIGGFGADRITGGSGSDRISGGDANDTIGARDGRRDKVRCGAGRDSVTADRADSVARDCERVRRG
jgi:Ca2+-binding RTX toxin-like protein